MTGFFYEVLGFIFEKILLPLFVIFLVLLIIAIPFFIYSFYKEESCCIKKENKLVHQEAYTSYVMSGKVMVPLFHPAMDVFKDVCVKSKDTCK